MDKITLREYTDIRFANIEKSTALALDSLDKRLDGVNEFRAVLTSQQATFSPRSEIDLMTKSTNDRLDKIEKQLAGIEGKGMGISQGIGWIIGVVSFVITIVVLFLKFK